MAWGLKFDGTNSSKVNLNATLAAAGADGTAQDWELEFRWTVEAGDEGSFQRPIGRVGDLNDRVSLTPSAKEVRLYHAGAYVSWILATFPSDAVYKFVKAAGSNNVELFVDTVSQGVKTQSTPGVCEISAFGRHFTYYTKGTLHYFKYTDNLSSANSVDFAIEEGTGTTTTDSLNGVVGTLDTTTAWVSEGGGGITLTLADATHAQTADSPTLAIAGSLSISEALHGHSADNIALTQAHTIVVAEATHAHSADNITLTTAGIITLSVMKNNTGTVIANDTGLTVDVYNISTGALVERFTGQSTDASGICSVTSGNIVGGTSYVVVVRRSTDAIGLEEVAAA